MSFMDRLLADPQIDDTVKEELQNLTAFLMKSPLSYRNTTFEPQLTAAYLQHYGFPTQVYDFSAHLGVAAYFALDPEVDDVGLIAALPPQRNDQLTIRDIRSHPYARRPHVQHAFGLLYNTLDPSQLVDGQFVDLKLLPTIQALGLHWYAFYHDERERRTWGEMYGAELGPSLEDPSDDPYREIAELLVEHFVQYAGDLSEAARKLLYLT
jgi:hypothetical protein